jgi:tRNA threonylcarbamoyladenosine biosynthesis protein TsaB
MTMIRSIDSENAFPRPASSQWVLALDTATNTASIALCCDGRVVETGSHDSSGHSSELLPMIDSMCKRHGVAPTSLAAVAVGVGPGSFTGLRIGMATAKGIAYAASVPLWGVSSLAAIAWETISTHIDPPSVLSIAIMDARRGEVFIAAYRFDGLTMISVTDEEVIKPTGVAAYIARAQRLAPDFVSKVAGDGCNAFSDLLGPLAANPQDRLRTPSAAAIALLAVAAAGRGTVPDLMRDGTPVYIRKSEAEVNYPDGVPGAVRVAVSAPPDDSPQADPVAWAAKLAQMRNIGLRLDQHGVFFHQGVVVSHPRLHQALLNWLAVDDDGRNVIRLDSQRFAYVDIDDTHLRAKSASWQGDRCFVTWDDGTCAELNYHSLRIRTDNALQVTVRDRLIGVIKAPAYYQIVDRAEATASGMDNGFELPAAGQRWPLRIS